MARISKQVGKRRLLKLAALLEADAKNKKGVKFNLSTVVAQSVGGSHVVHTEEDFEPSMSCGTTACAIGLAAVSGAFKRQGLSCKFDPKELMIRTTWKGKCIEYDVAAVRLFGISTEEANYLFTPCYYREKSDDGWGDDCMSRVVGAKGERRVATRIRKLVAGEVTTADTNV